MAIRSIRQAKIKSGTRVLVRADFDVALEHGKIASDFRMRKVIPTINLILKKGGKVRIISALGRPKDKTLALSMQKIALHLENLLRRKVVFIKDPFVQETYNQYNDTEILFFENVQFWSEEQKNAAGFAKKLAQWGDIYVNEAFAKAHRSYASVVALAKLLPAFAGLQFEKEIFYLSKVLKNSKRPLVAVLGGAKLETKFPLVINFLKYADRVLIGGALANTIFHLEGINVGKSLVDTTHVNKNIFSNKKLVLPEDLVVTTSLAKHGSRTVRAYHQVKDHDIVADIGPKSARMFSTLAKSAKTIIWNGPLGFTEMEAFAQGTRYFAGGLKKHKGLKIAGGGDTIAFLEKENLLSAFTHVSTGGGAMLEFLAGKKLPGIEALKSADRN